MEARQRIRVQYSLAGGGYKQIELAATGAKAAIASVLGVAEEVTPAETSSGAAGAIDRRLAEAKSKDRTAASELGRLRRGGDGGRAPELHRRREEIAKARPTSLLWHGVLLVPIFVSY